MESLDAIHNIRISVGLINLAPSWLSFPYFAFPD